MNPPAPPPPDFDDRRPLVIGCLIALVAVIMLGSAFFLGAWSVLQEQKQTPPPAVEKNSHGSR